jgi:hypothetical protein
MKFKLRHGREAFQVMSGELAGRSYSPGQVYGEIPEEEKHRFVEYPQKPATRKKPKQSAKAQEPSK